MSPLRHDHVGISPAGALGVAFFYHLSGEMTRLDGSLSFIDRTGSESGRALRFAGGLKVRGVETEEVQFLTAPFLGTVKEAIRCNALPGTLLICANPDQLFAYVTEFVEILEVLDERSELDDCASQVPVIVLLANGIYFQRVRQVLIEKIEESILLGRLSDLWPERMPAVVGKLIRGVTMQTALRDGRGAEAIYKPGPPSVTTLAGGAAGPRSRVCRQLQARGGRFEDAVDRSATRIEFTKAFVNLNSNLLGMIQAVDELGRYRPLRLQEIYTSEFKENAERLIRTVLRIGKAVHAFRNDESAEPIIRDCFEIATRHPAHVPSSIQWVDQEIKAGRLRAEIPPTEAWLLNPLLHYARSAGLSDEATYLEMLSQELLRRLHLARVYYRIGG